MTFASWADLGMTLNLRLRAGFQILQLHFQLRFAQGEFPPPGRRSNRAFEQAMVQSLGSFSKGHLGLCNLRFCGHAFALIDTKPARRMAAAFFFLDFSDHELTNRLRASMETSRTPKFVMVRTCSLRRRGWCASCVRALVSALSTSLLCPSAVLFCFSLKVGPSRESNTRTPRPLCSLGLTSLRQLLLVFFSRRFF